MIFPFVSDAAETLLVAGGWVLLGLIVFSVLVWLVTVVLLGRIFKNTHEKFFGPGDDPFDSDFFKQNRNHK